MSLLDQLAGQAGGLDLGGIAGRFGLNEEQVRSAASLLLPKIADPGQDNVVATHEVAQQTGIPHGVLAQLVPALLNIAQAKGVQVGVLGSLLSGLAGGGGAP